MPSPEFTARRRAPPAIVAATDAPVLYTYGARGYGVAGYGFPRS